MKRRKLLYGPLTWFNALMIIIIGIIFSLMVHISKALDSIPPVIYFVIIIFLSLFIAYKNYIKTWRIEYDDQFLYLVRGKTLRKIVFDDLKCLYKTSTSIKVAGVPYDEFILEFINEKQELEEISFSAIPGSRDLKLFCEVTNFRFE